MLKFETVTVTAPSHWASALINLDYSGLEKEEIGQINTFLAEQGLSFSDCLNCKHVGFLWGHDAFAQCPLGADCQEYTFKA